MISFKGKVLKIVLMLVILYLIMKLKQLWIYPLSLGIIGALIGLVLRYAYTGSIENFSFKNVLHAHSHVMLLGFIFNAMFLLIYASFTEDVDRVTKRFFIVLQLFMLAMMIAFIIQGYALYSIIFSTAHLWLSYILLIRLWRNLNQSNPLVFLVKSGIVLHFLSSLGPYALGPLMALNMKASPWYQQAIFFYLHFQFFGVYFCWMLALFCQKVKYTLSKSQINFIVFGLVLLYSHSLDYSFNNVWINIVGGAGAIIVLTVLFQMKTAVNNSDTLYRAFYVVLLSLGLLNAIGAIPAVGDLATKNRFILIAWLHLIFLGMYVPFIWISLQVKIKYWLWLVYTCSVVFSELVLITPSIYSKWLNTNAMQLLFLAYFIVFLSITIVHTKYLIDINKSKRILN